MDLNGVVSFQTPIDVVVDESGFNERSTNWTFYKLLAYSKTQDAKSKRDKTQSGLNCYLTKGNLRFSFENGGLWF